MRPTRSKCFYCGDPVLKGRSEEDHFPVPQSCGGTHTVTACHQCHDLKDRTSWEDMPLEFKAKFLEQVAQMPREAKIVLAQFMRVAFESTRHLTHQAPSSMNVGDRWLTSEGWREITSVNLSDGRAWYGMRDILPDL